MRLESTSLCNSKRSATSIDVDMSAQLEKGAMERDVAGVVTLIGSGTAMMPAVLVDIAKRDTD